MSDNIYEDCGEDKVCLTTCAECDLKTFENIKKQGAIEELEKLINWINILENMLETEGQWEDFNNNVCNKIKNRLKELKEGV